MCVWGGGDAGGSSGAVTDGVGGVVTGWEELTEAVGPA